MRKSLRSTGKMLFSCGFAAALLAMLLHQAPQRHANPAEFEPISYHPYVAHAAGEERVTPVTNAGTDAVATSPPHRI